MLGVESFVLGWEKMPRGVRVALGPLTKLRLINSHEVILEVLRPAMLQYMVSIGDALDTAPEHLREKLGGNGSVPSTTRRRLFFRKLQKEETVQKYAQLGLMMLLFARRVAAKVEEDRAYDLEFDAVVNEGPAFPWFSESLCDHAGRELPDQPIELFEYVARFFRLCFLVQLDVVEPDTSFFVYSFLMLASMNQKFGWSGQVELIKQHAAKLKYLLRGTVLLEVRRCARDDARPPEVLTLASVGLDVFVSEGNNHTPFQALRLLTSGLSLVAPERAATQVIWVLETRIPYDELQLTGTGEIVSFTRHVRFVARALLAELEQCQSEVVFGMQSRSALAALGPVTDNLADASDGYWGGNSVLDKHPIPLLLTHLMGMAEGHALPVPGGRLCYQLMTLRDAGVGVWNIGCAQAWLCGPVRRFEMLLALATHIVGGMPPRGTEYPPLLLRNTGLQKRSVMWTPAPGQRLFLLQRYHKTRACLQLDKWVHGA